MLMRTLGVGAGLISPADLTVPAYPVVPMVTSALSWHTSVTAIQWHCDGTLATIFFGFVRSPGHLTYQTSVGIRFMIDNCSIQCKHYESVVRHSLWFHGKQIKSVSTASWTARGWSGHAKPLHNLQQYALYFWHPHPRCFAPSLPLLSSSDLQCKSQLHFCTL